MPKVDYSYLQYMSPIAYQLAFKPYEFDTENAKSKIVGEHTLYNLAMTQSMFKHNGLPDTIPQYMLETYLQTNTFVVYTHVNDVPYVFYGGFAGLPDAYDRPTQVTVNNPALRFNKTLTIGKDCEIIYNDTAHIGLLPIFRKYGTLIAESEISLRIAAINTRLSEMLSSDDDGTRKSAEKYLKDIEQGKLGVIGESAFFDGIKKQGSTSNEGLIKSLIELEQYCSSIELHKIGVNSNFNMKREALNSAESTLNDDILRPFVYDMLKNRQEGYERINKLYGTHYSVELDGIWAEKAEETPPEQEQEPEPDKEPEPEQEKDGENND